MPLPVIECDWEGFGMRITDSAYITSMKSVVFQPALEAFEAAMLSAAEKKPRGALAYARKKEAERWCFGGFTCKRSASGRHSPAR